MSSEPVDRHTVGVILIGGQSQRFGIDKASIRINGSTLAERLAESMRGVLETVVASGRPEQAAFLGADIRLIPDRFEHRGPLAAIASVFAATTQSWLAVGACDMPGITPAAIRRMLELRTTDADAIIARDASGRLHPLFACYRRSTSQLCAERVENDNLNMTGFVRSIAETGLVLYPTFSDNVLVNINRPDDLESFERASRFSRHTVDTT